MNYAVIMAGGSGTRFWPESRSDRPKQFLNIAGDEPMITLTARRLLPVVPPERIFVVTHASQTAMAGASLEPLGIPPANIISEPRARNTAAAVGLAACILLKLDPDAVFSVLPADHVITPQDRFQESLQESMDLAASGGLYTFGIRPSYAATGYGYIEVGERVEAAGSLAVYGIRSFEEKPDLTRAKKFVASGRFLWNSGIFVWRAEEILAEIRTHCPELSQGLEQLPISTDPLSWQSISTQDYSALPALPIDMAVMERSSRGYVTPVDYEWSDVGSWDALDELHPADAAGNRAIFPAGGNLLVEDAKGVLAFSSHEHLIAVIGIEDVVVIHSDNATLIAPKDRCEDVKKIVARLQNEELDDYL